MPDSINKVCSVQFDIHKYIQHLDSFCRVDGNCRDIHRKKIARDYSFKKKAKRKAIRGLPQGFTGVVVYTELKKVPSGILG